MNINHLLLILTIKLVSVCSTENLQVKRLSEPDLRVDFQQDGETIQLEAFKSHDNDLIINEKNVQSYKRHCKPLFLLFIMTQCQAGNLISDKEYKKNFYSKI